MMFEFFSEPMLGLEPAMLNWIALAVIVLAALLILYLLFRLIRRPRLASGRRSKQARLAITDAALIDERRKLVLVRRDDVEHLIMIGGATDMVIEGDIRKNAPARPLQTPDAVAAAPALREPVAAPPPPPQPAPEPRSEPKPEPRVEPRAEPVAPVPAAAAPRFEPKAIEPEMPGSLTSATRPAEPVMASVSPLSASPLSTSPMTASRSAFSASVAPAVSAAGAALGSAAASAVATAENAANSTIGTLADQVSAAPPADQVSASAPEVVAATKSTVSDDMTALLDEITAKK